MTLTPLRDFTLGVTHNRIENGYEIVQPDWGYIYDTLFFTGVPDPMDWRVDPSDVGKRARDCCVAWEYFIKPLVDFQI